MVLTPAKVDPARFFIPVFWLSVGRWSFGGNRLQIKAETRLMADVDLALRAVAQVGLRAEGGLQALDVKVELLHILLDNEQMRLAVWLYPLDHQRRHVFSSHPNRVTQDVSRFLDGLPKNAKSR